MCVHNPYTRGYYVQRLEIYKQLLSGTKFWQDREREVHKYFALSWRIMIINYNINLDLLKSHANFDWIKWKATNPANITWIEWREMHRVVDICTN